MGNFKEELKNFGKDKIDNQIDFKARIEFDHTIFYVLDNFEYDGRKYFYIVEDKSKELEDCGGFEKYKGKIRMEYIYEDEPGIYQTVTDTKLLKKLDVVQSARILSGKI